MKKKGKIMNIYEDYGVFILFVSYELHTIKGDALVELVNCKSLKSIHKQKFPEKPNISEFLTGLQRLLPDMSDPQPESRPHPSPWANLA
jgi:hypothetical protein